MPWAPQRSRSVLVSFYHALNVGFAHLCGMKFELLTCLQIHTIRICEAKIKFSRSVQQMKHHDFMLVVAQMLQGTDQRLGIFLPINMSLNTKTRGTPWRGLRTGAMQINGVAGIEASRFGQQSLQFVVEHAVMRPGRPSRRLKVQIFREQTETYSITLTTEQSHQGGRSTSQTSACSFCRRQDFCPRDTPLTETHQSQAGSAGLSLPRSA